MNNNFFLKFRQNLGNNKPSARCYASGHLILNHELPQEQSNRKYFMEKSKVLQAKSLIQENPVEWTPTKLAQHFSVPIPLIQAHVPLPTRRMLKQFRQLNRDLNSTPYASIPKTPQQQVLDNWVQNQTNRTQELKAKKRNWRLSAQKEITNIDMVWLLHLEKKMSLLQEKAIIQLDNERRERRERGGGADSKKSGVLEKKAK